MPNTIEGVTLYTVPELVELLDRDRKTIVRYIKEGRLKGYNFGKFHLVNQADLKAFLLEESKKAKG